MGGFDLGSLGGGLLGAGLDFLGTAYTNRLQTKQMHEQMNYDQQMQNTKYQRQVKDLQAAGLNPMLAVGQNPGSPTPAPGPTKMKPDLQGSFNQSRIASAQTANIEEDTRKKNAETTNTQANTLLQIQQEEGAYLDNLNKALLPDETKARIDQYRTDIALGQKRISDLDSQIAERTKQIESLDAQIKNTKENTLLVKQKTEHEKSLRMLTDEKIHTQKAISLGQMQDNFIKDLDVETVKRYSAHGGVYNETAKKAILDWTPFRPKHTTTINYNNRR